MTARSAANPLADRAAAGLNDPLAVPERGNGTERWERDGSGTAIARRGRGGDRRVSFRDVVHFGPALNPRWRPPRRHEVAERAFDVTIALIALVFFAFVLGLIAALIAAERSGPVLFSHSRVGRQGRMIRVLKIRTMLPNSDALLQAHLAAHPEAAAEWARDFKLRRDPRVTPLGDFLRKSSLDEIPQFLNVLRGEMSVVGPRPIVVAEQARYGRGLNAYLSVRPGITGLWQVSGRNNVSYRRRVAMDKLYARRKSLLLDLSIIVRTVPAVLLRKGSF